MANEPIFEIKDNMVVVGPDDLVMVGPDYEYPEPSPEFYPWPGDPNQKAVAGSGTLRLRASIGAEAGLGSSANVALNGSSAIRDLIGKGASTQTKMSEFYGASALAFDKTQTPAQAGGGYAGYGSTYHRGGSGNATSWGLSISCAGGSGSSPSAQNALWADVGLKPSKTYRVDYDVTLTRSGPGSAVYAGVTTSNRAGTGFVWSHSSSWGISTTTIGYNYGPPFNYDVSWNEGGTMVNHGGGQTSTRNSSWYNITTGSGNNYFCIICSCSGNPNGNSGSGSTTIHSLTLTEL